MNPRKDLCAIVEAAVRPIFVCPRGHRLPHRTPSGRCSPVDCMDTGEPAGGALVPRPAAPLGVPTIDELLAEAAADELAKHRRMVVRQAERAKMLPAIPPPAPDVDPKQWTKEQLARLLPAAVYEKEFALLYGGMEMRGEVASEIMDRMGIARRGLFDEPSRGPVVIVNVAGGVASWDAQLAQVVDVKALGAGNGA